MPDLIASRVWRPGALGLSGGAERAGGWLTARGVHKYSGNAGRRDVILRDKAYEVSDGCFSQQLRSPILDCSQVDPEA